MKLKIIRIIPALIVLAALGFSKSSQWCILYNSECYSNWVHHIYFDFTNPLYFFTLYSLPLAIILIFIRRDVFNSWLKLALWAVPLSIVFIANTDVTSGGAYFVIYPFYRDDAARFAAEVFSLASLTLIVLKSIMPRINEFYRKKYEPAEAEVETEDLLVLCVSSTGLTYLIFSIFFLLSNLNSAFSLLQILVVMSIFSTIYGFSIMRHSLYERISGRTKLRTKARFNLLLLSINTGIIASAFLLVLYANS